MRDFFQRRGGAMLFGAGIVGAVLLVFGRIIGHAFLLDWDDQMIYANPHLKSLAWDNVRWMFTDTDYHYRRIYMPLSWLWWTLVNQSLGLSPGVYHSINLAFHALNAVLVFFLIRRIIFRLQPAVRPGKNAGIMLIAAFAALVWALHPLRVEPVAWAITQKFLIGTALLLGAIFSWLRWLDSSGGFSAAARWYLPALSCFTASLLFYPMAVAAPGVFGLLALSWNPPAGGPQAAWRPRFARAIAVVAPFLVVSVLVMLPALGFSAARHTGAGAATSPVHAQLAEAAYVWMYFLWKPLTLGPFSPVYTNLIGFDPLAWPFLASAVGLVAVTALAILGRRRRPWMLVLWLSHLVLLVPVLGFGLTTENYLNDRYCYQAGICWVVFLSLLMVRLPWTQWPKPARQIALLLGAGWLLLLGQTTKVQAATWLDAPTFFQHTLQRLGQDKYSSFIHARLANFMAKSGDRAGAVEQFREALRINPAQPSVHNNLGLVYAELGRPAEAMASFTAAVQYDPTHTGARFNWAQELIGQKNYGEAAVLLAACVERRPDSPRYRLRLAEVLLVLSRRPEALVQLNAARDLSPPDANSHLMLGRGFLAAQQPAMAIQHLEQAQRLQPDLAGVEQPLRLARALTVRGSSREARP